MDISKAIDKAAGAEREDAGPSQTCTGKSQRDGMFTGNPDAADGVPLRITRPATPDAATWSGYGSALKPAFEPVILAMAPLDGTFAHNALTHGVAGLNIDGGRVGTNGGGWNGLGDTHDESQWRLNNPDGVQRSAGRWPANLILSHSPGCVQRGVRKVKSAGWKDTDNQGRGVPYHVPTTDGKTGKHYASPDGTETVAAWDCVEGCPVALLDAQSGELKSGGRTIGTPRNGSTDHLSGLSQKPSTNHFDASTGGASRYFQHCNWGEDDVRFRYQAKASRRERNHGLDSTRTIKYNMPQKIGGISCQDASTALVESLKRATSGSTVRWLIGESGESIMGLCPSDSLSTTLTAINRITTSQIFDSLTPLLTNGYIQGANSETVFGGNPVTSARNSSPSTASTGTSLKRDGPCTDAVGRVISELLSEISDGENWHVWTNTHSTVKPLALMRYLVKLTRTPTGGVVLDPFMGSGSTGVAAVLEGRDFVGIELGAESYDIARQRIEAAQREVVQLAL